MERASSVGLSAPKDNLAPVHEEVTMLSAAEVMRLLDLKPHPEGGHFCETFRDVLRDAHTVGADDHP
jgi:hypothetical protein